MQLKPKDLDFIQGIGIFGHVYFHDSFQNIRTAFAWNFVPKASVFRFSNSAALMELLMYGRNVLI